MAMTRSRAVMKASGAAAGLADVGSRPVKATQVIMAMTASRASTETVCNSFQTAFPVHRAQSRVKRPIATTQNPSVARMPPAPFPSMAPARPPMMSMMAAQPMSCTMLSTAARFDPRIPKAGRIETIDMIPCSEPITPPSPMRVLPMRCPRRMAQSPAQNPRGARNPPAQISASEMATPAHSQKNPGRPDCAPLPGPVLYPYDAPPKKIVSHEGNDFFACRRRTPSRFPTLALPRSGSTGVISGLLKGHPVSRPIRARSLSCDRQAHRTSRCSLFLHHPLIHHGVDHL
jgi:hypothetical protein